jgi:hypothetical protein
MQVTREWLNGSSKIYAVQVTADDGKRFDVILDRGWIQWADLEVWEEPAKYGLSRYTCPGHGKSGVCQYGAHDEVRFADTAWLAARGYPVKV